MSDYELKAGRFHCEARREGTLLFAQHSKWAWGEDHARAMFKRAMRREKVRVTDVVIYIRRA